MNFNTETLSGHRVEVSGWDAKEDFFVEKTYFDAEEEGKKEIKLLNSLREGCVLFLRVLEPLSTGSNFPVVYQAVHVASRDADGRLHVGLKRLQPRASRARTDFAAHQITFQVA